MKKNFSRIIAAFLAVIMVLTAAPMAYANDDIASGTAGDGVNWSISADGTLTISGEGEPVVGWYSTPWYDYNESITAVVVEEGITALADTMLCYLDKCISVSIPSTVSEIGDIVFWAHSSLEEINVDAENNDYCSVDGVLYNKDMTTLIIYPANKADTEFDIPSTVTTLEEYSFWGIKNIVKLDIPDTVETILDDAFSCSYIKEINIGNGVTEIAESVFLDYYGDKLVIPDSIETIKRAAFRGANIKTITIGTGVTSIGDSAFGYCNDLMAIHYTGTPEQFAAIQVDSKNNEIFFETEVHYLNNGDVKEGVADATCLIDAHTSGYYCNECEMFVTGKTIEYAPGHDWDSATSICGNCDVACQHAHYDMDEICDICGGEVPFNQFQLDTALSITVPEGEEVYYRFTAPETGSYAVYTFGCGAGDPRVVVYHEENKIYKSDNDSGEGENAYCSFEIDKGDTIFIILDNYSEIPFSAAVCKHVDIDHQPTAGEPYVDLIWDVEATYQWYEVEYDDGVTVTDEIATPYDGTYGTTVYDEELGWLGAFDGYENELFYIELEQYEVLKFEASDYVYEVCIDDVEDGNYYDYDDLDNGEVLYFEAPATSTYYIYCWSEKEDIYYQAELIKPQFTKLDGETSATLQNSEVGKYYCCIVTTNDKTIKSETFENVYAITSQPTSNNATVGVNDDTDATYQWYIVDEKYDEITDQNAQAVEYDWGSSYYDSEKGWIGIKDTAGDNGFYVDFFTIDAGVGEVIYVETDNEQMFYAGLYDYETGHGIWSDMHEDLEDAYLEVDEDGVYTATAVGISGETCMTAYYYIREYTALEGETSPTLSTTDPNTYVCLVTYSDGTTEYSNDVKIVESGWYADDNGWYYIDTNGEKVVNNWMQDSVGWCYLGADGYMATNQWIMDSVGWCYVGADGYCVTNCWMADSVGWCYLDSEGRMATNQWIMDSVGWCYVGADGYCITNSWMKDSIGWCYLDANGRMVYNTWVQDSVGWCYVGADGYMVYDQWVQDSNGWCYIGPDGYWVA